MNGSGSVKRPCVGCVYFDACGETGRTAPCEGRVTKKERKKGNEKDKKEEE